MGAYFDYKNEYIFMLLYLKQYIHILRRLARIRDKQINPIERAGDLKTWFNAPLNERRIRIFDYRPARTPWLPTRAKRSRRHRRGRARSRAGRRRRRRCCRLMWRPRADPGGPPLEWVAVRRRSGRRRQARPPHGLASVTSTLVDVANKWAVSVGSNSNS